LQVAAEFQSNSLWAEHVQQRIQEQHDIGGHEGVCDLAPNSPSRHDSSCLQSDVSLLRIGSPPDGSYGLHRFRELLSSGPTMRRIREDLSNAGYTCELPGGAIMLVEPEQVPGVQRALVGKTLHRFHIVIKESFEYLIDEILADFTFQERPKLKTGVNGRDRLQLLEEKEETSAIDERSCVPCVMVYERTFLSWKPCLTDARTACQSTTEIFAPQSTYHFAYPRGINVRRLP